MRNSFHLPQLEFSSPKQLLFAIREIFSLLWKIDKKLFSILLFFNILDGFLSLPMIYLEKLILDKTVASIGTNFLSEALKALGLLIIIRFTLQLVQDITRRVIGIYNNLLGRRFSDRLELIIGDKYSSLDLTTIESPQFKDRYHKVERESRSRAWNLVGTFYDIPNNLSALVSSLAILLFFQPSLVFVLLILLIPSFIIDAKSIKKEYEIETKNSFKNRVWGWLTYYLIRPRGYMEVRLLKLKSYLLAKLKTIQDDMFIEKQQLRTKRHILLQLFTLPQQIFNSFMALFFTYLVIIGQITLGTAGAYTRALDGFRSGTIGLLRSLVNIFESYLYISDLIWFLNLTPEINGSQGVNFPQALSTGVEFRHVWFRYTATSPWIIKDLSFTIDPHENIAIVGHNGAGKTTLIKLLCRFYEPSRGQILINGLDLKKYKRDQYWDRISVLFQEFESYPFTARESIGYGNIAQINDLDLIRSQARKTNIDEFIMGLPKKYENPVSNEFDAGVNPSFGQAQRMGISRSFMKQSTILVLDEPTSNVDPEAEEEIFNQVLKLGKEKILVFISHRFSTVRRADRIVLIDNGHVAESGTHDQLIALHKQYAQLFQLQAKNYQ